MTEENKAPQGLAARGRVHRFEVSSMLEQRLSQWVHEVLEAYEAPGMSDTHQMVVDVDRIIADEFNYTPILEENQSRQTAELSM